MGVKLKKLFWLRVLMIVSGICLLCGIFLPLTVSYSLITIFEVSTDPWENFVYAIPYFNSVLILASGFFLEKIYRYRKFVLYIILIINSNLTTLLLAGLFQTHGSYLWRNPAIFFIITGSFFSIVSFIGILAIGFDETISPIDSKQANPETHSKNFTLK